MSHALLGGCGRLGSAVGLALAASGHDVLALRRHADQVPAPLRGLSVDLTREEPPLTEPADLLVVALTARPRTEESYRATYVDGLARVLDALDRLGRPPRRAVLVSSTAVNGDPPDPADVVTEETPPAPHDGPGRMLLEAERLFASRLPQGTVLRLSGLYGDRRPRLVDQVLAGEVSDPHRWTNRIHRDDAAAAVVHLLTRADPPGRLYLGTDDEPAQLGDVAAHVARGLPDAPVPPAADPALGHGKRLSNAALRSTGWVPSVPTYRQGYTM